MRSGRGRGGAAAGSIGRRVGGAMVTTNATNATATTSGGGGASSGYTYAGGRAAVAASYRRAVSKGDINNGQMGFEAIKERGVAQGARLLALERAVRERKKRNKVGQQKGRWVQEAMAMKAARRELESELRKLVLSGAVPDGVRREIDNEEAVRVADQRGLSEAVNAIRSTSTLAKAAHRPSASVEDREAHRSACGELNAAVTRELARLVQEQQDLEAELAIHHLGAGAGVHSTWTGSVLGTPAVHDAATPTPRSGAGDATSSSPPPPAPSSGSGAVVAAGCPPSTPGGVSAAPSVMTDFTTTTRPAANRTPEFFEHQALAQVDAVVAARRAAGAFIDDGLVATYREGVRHHVARLRHALEEIEHTVVTNHFRPRGYAGLAQPSTYARSQAFGATASVMSCNTNPYAVSAVGGVVPRPGAKTGGLPSGLRPAKPPGAGEIPHGLRRGSSSKAAASGGPMPNATCGTRGAGAAADPLGSGEVDVTSAAPTAMGTTSKEELEHEDDAGSGCERAAVEACPAGNADGAEATAGVERVSSPVRRRDATFVWMASLPGMVSLKTLVASVLDGGPNGGGAGAAEATATTTASRPTFPERLRQESAASRQASVDGSEGSGADAAADELSSCRPSGSLNRLAPPPMNEHDLNQTASTIGPVGMAYEYYDENPLRESTSIMSMSPVWHEGGGDDGGRGLSLPHIADDSDDLSLLRASQPHATPSASHDRRSGDFGAPHEKSTGSFMFDDTAGDAADELCNVGRSGTMPQEEEEKGGDGDGRGENSNGPPGAARQSGTLFGVRAAADGAGRGTQPGDAVGGRAGDVNDAAAAGSVGTLVDAATAGGAVAPAAEGRYPARLRRESVASRSSSRADGGASGGSSRRVSQSPPPPGAEGHAFVTGVGVCGMPRGDDHDHDHGDPTHTPSLMSVGPAASCAGSVAVATLLTSVDPEVSKQMDLIMKGFKATGGSYSRTEITDRVALYFPTWSKARVQEELWKYERGKNLSRRVGIVFADARKALVGLLGTFDAALGHAEELKKAEAAHEAHLAREVAANEALRRRVDELRAARADAEAARVAEQLREAEEDALLREAEDCIKTKEFEDRLRKLASHREACAEQALLEQERQRELDLANAAAAAKQAAINSERVAFRAENYQAKQDRMREEHELAEYEKVMRQEVLSSIAASVAPVVPRDPVRTVQATQASASVADPQLINEMAAPNLKGYSAAAITKDKRFRLIQALGDAGLLQTDYARTRITAAAPAQKGLATHADNPLRIQKAAGKFPMPAG